LEQALLQLPPALMESRATNWAAYLAGDQVD
jgi:hypothetical protein